VLSEILKSNNVRVEDLTMMLMVSDGMMTKQGRTRDFKRRNQRIKSRKKVIAEKIKFITFQKFEKERKKRYESLKVHIEKRRKKREKENSYISVNPPPLEVL
jgi:hypothetical protein